MEKWKAKNTSPRKLFSGLLETLQKIKIKTNKVTFSGGLFFPAKRFWHFRPLKCANSHQTPSICQFQNEVCLNGSKFNQSIKSQSNVKYRTTNNKEDFVAPCACACPTRAVWLKGHGCLKMEQKSLVSSTCPTRVVRKTRTWDDALQGHTLALAH